MIQIVEFQLYLFLYFLFFCCQIIDPLS